MFCLASSHSHTTKYDLHSHFTDETTAHEENRHRRWRFFEGSPRLESPHGGFAPCTVSLCYYPASRGYLYPSFVYTEISQVMVNLFFSSSCFKSRWTGKSFYTTRDYDTVLLSICDWFSVRNNTFELHSHFLNQERRKHLWHLCCQTWQEYHDHVQIMSRSTKCAELKVLIGKRGLNHTRLFNDKRHLQWR